MPFVKEQFFIPHEQTAFLYVMKTLHFTQGEAQRHIAKGRLIVDGISMKITGQKIQGEVEMVYFKPASRHLSALFASKNFMIFEKPSGVLVHPNSMRTPYCMLDEIRTYGGAKANACHRIDMETSGLLLASKNKASEKALKTLFETKKIKKSYLAWVDGKITHPFSSDASISIYKDGFNEHKHKAYIDEGGKASHTDFVPLDYDEKLDASLIACYPHTGRTHQIRVHLFHVKHPILGDPLYGASATASNRYLDQLQSPQERLIEHGASRLMLHAQSLTFLYEGSFHIESKEDFTRVKNLIAPKDIRRFNR
jgi:23S rRNA pseudouridine1911/1915/1917 synthase